MKKFLSIIPLVFLLCFTFSCQKGEEVAEEPVEEKLDLAQVRKASEEQGKKFIEAALQGDAAAAVAGCTEDTFLLPPNSELLQGKQATEAFWQARWAQVKITEFDITTEDLYGSGDVVYEVGKYTLKFQLEGLESLEEKGKYVLIWKKMADGTWKRHVDIWNSDAPMQ